MGAVDQKAIALRRPSSRERGVAPRFDRPDVQVAVPFAAQHFHIGCCALAY